MSARDEIFAADGVELSYLQWPSSPAGDIEEGHRTGVDDVEAVPGELDEETGETITEPVAEVGHFEMAVTTRAMTAAEVEQWHIRNPPPPLIEPEARPDEDTMAASVALLTEDSVGYRALLTLIVQALQIPAEHVAAAQAAATERLVALADDPELRRAMMAERIARAEAARGD